MKVHAFKGLGFLLALFAVVFFVGSVQAQMPDHMRDMMGAHGKKEGKGYGKGKMGYGNKGYGGPGHPFDLERFQETLNLTDEQLEKFRKIRSNYRKEMIKRKANLEVAEIELWELIESKTLDMGKIEKKLNEVQEYQANVMLYRIKSLGETQKLLSDEQYEEFRKMGLGSMRHRMGRHGMMEGMGGGQMGGMHPGGMMGGMSGE
ncbi:MAG TPA: Spy/CpxP family protein refolding chaperone [Nitrospiria bacterium]|jgi:Spy/CpxP family protein refolding chaperone